MRKQGVHFWAKTTEGRQPGITVFRHMMNVGCVAECIAEVLPQLLERFNLQAQTVGALSALHDLGKISPGFQRKCRAWLEINGLEQLDRNGCWDTGTEPDHGKVSHAAIQAFLMEVGFNRKTAKYVSSILGGHHGRLNPPSDRGYHPQGKITENQSGIDWDEERQEHARKIWSAFPQNAGNVEITDATPAIWWLAGLTTVSDWIGSDENFFSPDQSTIIEDSKTIARTALESIGFFPSTLIKGLGFEDIFPFPPNELQSKAIATITEPGVYVLEAPMGIGKTEAALAAAYHLMQAGKASGIYFALPTQVTSNRIHQRMNEFLQKISPDAASHLIHGNSWLMESAKTIHPAATETHGNIKDDARTGQNWFSSSKRALIAPFGVGTIDQTLLGVVAAKHFFVRHFALAGKVVILDEVHSYDLYTGTLIDKLIETLEGLGCTVIILSATLTEHRRDQILSGSEDTASNIIQPYPLISGRREGRDIAPVPVLPPPPLNIGVNFISPAKAEQKAITLAQKGGAVLWICNTVDSAQKQYQQIVKLAGTDFPIGLLHSRFPFWQREKLEKEWMGRFGRDGKSRCGSILISTQVVEQSVDLDADLLVTELAPTDMLLQRLGRLWRHDRKGHRPVTNAQVLILEETECLAELRCMEPKEIVKALGKKAWVYAPYVLLRSLEVWHAEHGKEITLPTQIRALIESTYEDREDPPSWSDLWSEWIGTDSAKKMHAQRNTNLWQVALEDAEGVQTRLNEVPTVSLVLCHSVDKQQAKFIDGTNAILGDDVFRLKSAQAIHKNLVRVPQYCYEKVTHKSPFSDYLFGNQCVGLVGEDGMIELGGLKGNTSLFYSDEMGLVIGRASVGENL